MNLFAVAHSRLKIVCDPDAKLRKLIEKCEFEKFNPHFGYAADNHEPTGKMTCQLMQITSAPEICNFYDLERELRHASITPLGLQGLLYYYLKIRESKLRLLQNCWTAGVLPAGYVDDSGSVPAPKPVPVIWQKNFSLFHAHDSFKIILPIYSLSQLRILVICD